MKCQNMGCLNEATAYKIEKRKGLKHLCEKCLRAYQLGYKNGYNRKTEVRGDLIVLE